jgi:outer membrane protein assembly factor BamB
MAFQSRLEISPVRFLAQKVLLVGLLFWLSSTTGSLLVADEAVDRLLGQAGVKKGIAVVLGLPGGDVAFPTRLAQSSDLLVHVQLQSVDQLQASREQARRQGLLGSRVTIEAGDAKSIYLASNIADLVYLPAGTLTEQEAIEVLRVLCPGGVSLIAGVTKRKPAPEGTDTWSHPYHGPDNNPRSTDQLARAPYITQFLATPFYGPMPEVTVAAGGRLFKVFGHIAIKEREWPLINTLVCIHGYNGTELWRRQLEAGFMVHRNLMVATDKELYLAFKESCLVIDAVTGETKGKVALPEGTTPDRTWKWMAIQDGVLYAMLGGEEQEAIVIKGGRTGAGWPWSGLGKGYAQEQYPWGFGRTLAAIDLESGSLKWSLRKEEPLDSRATVLRNGRMFYYSEKNYLGSLDVATGKELWQRIDSEILEAIGENDKAQTPRKGFSSSSFLKADDDVIYFAGPQRKNLVAVSAENGDLLWQHPHGNYQLILREDGVYAMGRTETSLKFDRTSGEILADLQCFRGNCTRATATVDSIFTRGYRHTGTQRVRLGDQQVVPSRIGLMRPACQDGVVVAHGQLYWGPWMCDCNLSLVGIISLAARGDLVVEEPAVQDERLEVTGQLANRRKGAVVDEKDWPAYRQGNQRHSGTPVQVGDQVTTLWTVKTAGRLPTQVVSAGGVGFYAGTNGCVEAIEMATGKSLWTAFTGAAVNFPPAISGRHVLVGSADGWVYCFEAATGRQLWRFQAAPIRRMIPVYGRLSSTWPVGSGVLVEDGVVYAAAGIASYDGTHLFALKVENGEIVWQNNTSGRLGESDDGAGISVQGHLLKNEDRLYLAGGNVVSPAVYSVEDGTCLNSLEELWTKTPRGRELFLVNDKVYAFDRLLYGPEQYQVGRYHAKERFAQAMQGEIIVRARAEQVVSITLDEETGEAVGLWENKEFISTAALAIAGDQVIVVGKLVSEEKPEGDDEPVEEAQPVFRVAGLNSQDGTTSWSFDLPGEPRPWGLSVDRDGRVVVALVDGGLVCLGNSPKSN